MILISSRKDFWEEDHVADNDQIRDVPNMDDFSLGTPQSEQWLQSQIGGKKVLLLIHGYNNDAEDVARAYVTIHNRFTALCPNQYDAILGYMWPGGDHFWEYKEAKDRASTVAFRVRYWLKRLKEFNVHLDVMTHSMGGRVILCALQDVEGVVVNNVYLTAAAVDNESIEHGEKYFHATQCSHRFYVFHSIFDPVLEWGYQSKEWDMALGYTGPEDKADIEDHSPHVKVVNCKRFIKAHGGYKRCEAMYAYVAAEFQNPGVHKQFFTLK